MSFRDKAREVKTAGEAERGNFTPHGVPLRMYQHWLDRAPGKKAAAIRRGTRKENFCHFWRVVLFWVPFWKVADALFTAAPYIGVALVVAAVAVFIWGLIVSTSMLVFVLQLLAILSVIVLGAGGLFGGSSLAMSAELRKRAEMPPLRIAILLSILGLPTAIVSFLVTKAAIFYNGHFRAYDLQFAIGSVALGVAVFMTVVGLSSGWLTVLFAVLGLVALAAAIVVTILGISWLSDYVSGKRKLNELEVLNAREAYYDKHGKWPEDEPRQPSRLAKFFSGLGDFIVLIAQVVRVNKWKICPFVEVETE